MNTSFYTAAVGTIQTMKGMDVLANNVSNISTVGYKTSTSTFSDLLYSNMKGESDNLKVGHGAKIDKTDTLFDVGNVVPTGRDLDFAITEKNAFFAVMGDNGNIEYTRNGVFSLSENEDGNFYLSTSAGRNVLDANGNPIAVTSDNIGDLTQKIGIYGFQNVDGLLKSADGCFTSNPTSGDAVSINSQDILFSGRLEESSVNMAEQMTDVIVAQRAFQFNSRMVQISDEIEQTINNLR